MSLFDGMGREIQCELLVFKREEDKRRGKGVSVICTVKQRNNRNLFNFHLISRTGFLKGITND